MPWTVRNSTPARPGDQKKLSYTEKKTKLKNFSLFFDLPIVILKKGTIITNTFNKIVVVAECLK